MTVENPYQDLQRERELNRLKSQQVSDMTARVNRLSLRVERLANERDTALRLTHLLALAIRPALDISPADFQDATDPLQYAQDLLRDALKHAALENLDQHDVLTDDIVALIPEGWGALWWTASDRCEVNKWMQEYSEKGAIVLHLNPHDPNDIDASPYDFLFCLPVDRAAEILGYLPEESEWMDLDAPEEDAG